MKLYTIGEILRLGLLKNHKGEPYNNKGTISKVFKKVKFTTKKTPWGEAKCLTKDQIDKLNKERRYIND